MIVKLNSNGYTKIYADGKQTSIIGSYENDIEVTEYLANGGIIEPEFTQAELEAQFQDNFRLDRDLLLDSTDIYMLIDKYNTLTAEQQTVITDYRQALRDSTSNWLLPTKPVWLS